MIDTYYRPNGIEIIQSVHGKEDQDGHHYMSISLTIASKSAAEKIVKALTERFDLK